MGKIHRSRYNVDILKVDLLTFVFRHNDIETRSRPQYFDAFRPDRHFSLAQGEEYAKRIGLGLRKLGLESDDKVLLFSGNNLIFPPLLWGVIAADCVFTAVSPTASSSELENQLKASNSKVVITSLDLVDKAVQAAAKAGIPTDRVFIFCHPEDADHISRPTAVKPWTAFWASQSEGMKFQWNVSTDPKYLASKTVILNFSSGTTGPPKGVEITHANVVANSTQLVHYRTMAADRPSSHARRERLARSGERWLAPLPMYHAYGQIYYCVNAPLMAAKVYIMSRYEIGLLLLFVDLYRITFLTGVPTVLVQMSKQPAGRFNLESIEYALTGSAPLGGETARFIEKNFLPRGLVLRQGWGMTETTNSMSGFSPDDPEDFRSIGYLNPNCLGQVVPVEGMSWADEVPAGVEVGELWVSGGNVIKGYYNNPQATEQTVVMRDGIRWLRTGDVAYFDADGKIFIVDRLKELIKVEGLQVSPAELEAVIISHEGVADAAVLAAKIDGGEYPRAFVVKKDPTITESTVHDLIKERFAKHKWLTGGVYFINEIPKTPSGKAQKRRLPDRPAKVIKL